ncbi:MAG: hypothetical protein ACLPT6_00530 [Desulfobaccales bacterium]
MSKSPQTGRVLPQGVPGSMKKRQLLNDQELKAEPCREYGEKFLALGWWEDALEFFQKGHDSPGLEKIKNHCLETGDAYLLARLGVSQEPHTWQQLATRALDLGKFRFARRAYKLSGDPDKAAMVEALISGTETKKTQDQD